MNFQWFCCLNPAEKAAANAMLNWYILHVALPMPAVMFETLWSVGLPSRHKRRETFVTCYQLEETICFDEEGEPFECIGFVDLVWWSAFVVFYLSVMGDCGDGCTQPEWLA